MLATRHLFIDIAGIVLLGIVIFLMSTANSLTIFHSLPDSIYQMNMLFLSILIEALPFVLIGVLIAGFIQIFVTETMIEKWLPKNRLLAICASCFAGALFPACECGIVPIVRRLVGKGVPIYAGIGFLLTGPLINPIVIASTYMAFGNNMKIAVLRMVAGFIIAIIASFTLSIFFQGNELKHAVALQSHDHPTKHPFSERLSNMLKHTVDEFFDMGKYLVFGALAAAFVQTYISTGDLVSIGSSVAASTGLMMGLAYLLSLCSEADAFIGASFKNLFPTTAVLGFLIYGPMIDLKNTFMMLSVFRKRLVFGFILIVSAVVFGVLMLIQPFL